MKSLTIRTENHVELISVINANMGTAEKSFGLLNVGEEIFRKVLIICLDVDFILCQPFCVLKSCLLK
jgi:hypothetical protein